MDSFEVDQKYMESVSKTALGLALFITNQTEIICNKDEDIFIRYLCYLRIKQLIKSVSFCMENLKEMMSDGHNANHPFFNTDKYKDGGWSDINLDAMEFFCNKKNEQNENKSSH